jgi:hypothetical protein
MSSHKKKQPYTDILNKPIILYDTDTPDARIKSGLGGLVERFAALYHHFGLDPKASSETELILALAQKHVPGFKIEFKEKRARGPKSKFTGAGWYGFHLVALVAKHKTDYDCKSDHDAVLSIAKNEPAFSQYKDQPEDLYSRFMETKAELNLLKKHPKGNIFVTVFDSMLENLGLPEDEINKVYKSDILPMLELLMPEKKVMR